MNAAAGGVGLILCQWAKSLGAIVIGVVGNEEKAALAKKNGCKYALIQGKDEIPASVKKLTKGARRRRRLRRGREGCLHRLPGFAAAAGNDGDVWKRIGPVPPVSPLELSKRGSLFLDPADVVPLHRQARGLAGHGARSCSRR